MSWGPRGLRQHLQEVGLDTVQAWLAVPRPLPSRRAAAGLVLKWCVRGELRSSQLTAVSPLPQG